MPRTSTLLMFLQLVFEAFQLLHRSLLTTRRSSSHMQKEMRERQCRSLSLQQELSSVQAHAVCGAIDFAPQLYDRACQQLPQPVHTKAGSRWPERRDVRYAVVSLLSSPAPDLIPA